MAKYHCWPNYLAIYHYFGNIYGCTTLLEFNFQKFKFFEKIAFKFAVLFFMELKFLELKFHKKLVVIFHRLELHDKLKFQNSGRSLIIS